MSVCVCVSTYFYDLFRFSLIEEPPNMLNKYLKLCVYVCVCCVCVCVYTIIKSNLSTEISALSAWREAQWAVEGDAAISLIRCAADGFLTPPPRVLLAFAVSVCVSLSVSVLLNQKQELLADSFQLRRQLKRRRWLRLRRQQRQQANK